MNKAPYSKVLYLIGFINISLILMSLTSAFVFTFQEASGALLFWNAYGLCLPLFLIKLSSERMGRRGIGRLLSVFLAFLSLFLPYGNVAVTSWGISYFIFLIPALFAPRPDGRLLMTKPQIWHFLVFVILYGIGTITQVRETIITGEIFASVFILLFLMDRNMEGCRKRIRDAQGDVEASSIIKENRRVLIFYIASFIILASVLIPVLSSIGVDREKSPVVYSYDERETEEEKSYLPLFKDVAVSKKGREIDYSGVGNVLLYIFLAAIFIAFILIIYSILSTILNLDGEERKHRDEYEGEFTLQRINEVKKEKEEERYFSPSGRIRRMYKRLVLKEAEGESLRGRTVGEIEKEILPGPFSREIGELYSAVRYSEKEVTKKDISEMKENITSYYKNKKSSKWSGSHT